MTYDNLLSLASNSHFIVITWCYWETKGLSRSLISWKIVFLALPFHALPLHHSMHLMILLLRHTAEWYGSRFYLM